MAMQYRPDIDGLRALAVLAVVAFHAFPERVKGGFIGVDVFFVISGFLISTIIFKNLGNENFSFAEFYSRRVRRIFPALILVLISSLIFGWFALLPSEYQQLGRHAAAGAGFVSNFIFWNEAGYFDNSAETKPLLHLWSLSIEEQFYIFWPLLLWFAWKKKLKVALLISAVASLSFLLNIKTTLNAPIESFFFPHTRFWELLCGSLLAWLTIQGRNLSKLRTFISGLGLSFLVFGFLKISKASDFPGWRALIPVTGTFLIIFAGPQAWLNRYLLSHKVLVGIGLISYPLYLWHWPLLSFARILESTLPSSKIRLTLVGISFLLAWLTYKWVEQPIRRQQRFSRGVPSLLLSGGICLTLGLVIVFQNGFPQRRSPVTQIYPGDIGAVEYFNYWGKQFPKCTNNYIFSISELFQGIPRCMQSKTDPLVDFAIIGDSHAEQLFMGLAKALPQLNIAYYYKNALPFSDTPEFSDIFPEVLRQSHIKKVVLAAFWSRKIGNLPQNVDVSKKFIQTFDLLKKAGKTVFITDNLPGFPFDPNRCSQIRRFSSQTRVCSFKNNKEQWGYQRFERGLKAALPLMEGVHLIPLEKYICSNEECSMVQNGIMFYRDTNHLGINGSKIIGEFVARDNPALVQ